MKMTSEEKILKKQAEKMLRVIEGDYYPNILFPKISKHKKDSFFYEGDIAEVIKLNGTKLVLIATGNISLTLKGEKYWNNTIDDAIQKYNLTDKKLREFEQAGELSWEENNWFEVMWQSAGTHYMDSDVGIIAGDYDEAMELLKSYYENEEY